MSVNETGSDGQSELGVSHLVLHLLPDVVTITAITAITEGSGWMVVLVAKPRVDSGNINQEVQDVTPPELRFPGASMVGS